MVLNIKEGKRWLGIKPGRSNISDKTWRLLVDLVGWPGPPCGLQVHLHRGRRGMAWGPGGHSHGGRHPSLVQDSAVPGEAFPRSS